ncbi:MAG: histidine phosphatase family protein [Acidimicrobiia bacterium]|nr:histidine phosphatase family protein [Acidimicrobiia bacterium]
MLLFLVRHAHAVPRGRWEGPDLDRPLDDKGRRQAAAVAAHIGERLDGDPPPLVVASPAVRCVDSVAPLAQHYGIPVGTDARLLEIAEVDADSRPDPEDAVTWLADRLCDVVDDALAAGSGKGGVVICTHGQVLPPGIARIVDGVDLDAAVEHNDKGGFWVTVIEDGRCESAEYVGAP